VFAFVGYREGVTRIIAGRAGSLKLDVPRGPTRPTSDRVREAMFSTVDHLIDMAGARVLDLYAGSGALGLEACSRGADTLVFVESSPTALAVIRRNASAVTRAVGREVVVDVAGGSALTYCRGLALDQRFDLVLIDPPYDTPNDEVVGCVDALAGHLTAEAVVVVERGKKTAEPLWPEWIEKIRHKTYGDTSVFYLSPRR
jgi:16S rRNA (guanine966-N2)-methyltransferase